MEPLTRAGRYDLFKLIVAILLLILFLLLNRKMTPQSIPPISTPSVKRTAVSASSTSTSLTTTATLLPSPTLSSAVTQTMTPTPSVTETKVPISTQTPLSSPTVTKIVTPTAPPLSSATATTTPVIESTATPLAGTSIASACDSASSRSRLQTGMSAILLRRLNFRSSPGIHENWLLTNLPGTRVEIIGGPECLPHAAGAYVWWQIKLPDGQIGWSAEASRHGSFYFMEPVR
jgi:cytoskeletal protein RodZ